jgi:predicted ATPase/signal transduction histidine kinase
LTQKPLRPPLSLLFPKQPLLIAYFKTHMNESKLYGRSREKAQLLEAFERISGGTGEILLVPGPSGIGKTALVEELRNPVSLKNGFFLTGKFEQFQQNIPYFAFRQAIAEYCKKTQSKNDFDTLYFKNEILNAVGDLGQILIDFVPEFEEILGSQPPLGEISPQEARHRFTNVFQSFLKVLCRPEHPVVLFIDDWQWSDVASTELLRKLEIGSSIRYLIIIAAYRNDEMASGHQFFSAINELKNQHVKIEERFVSNLSDYNIKEILRDTYLPSIENIRDLAALIHHKTKGNPFFIRSYLNFLQENSLIWFNKLTNQWQWSSETKPKELPSSIVELFALKLKRLDQSQKDLFFLAACLGNRFNLQILSIISGFSTPDCQSLLLSETGKSMLLDWDCDQQEKGEKDISLAWRFLHDKVQQAAFTLVNSKEVPAVNLKIGRLFLSKLSPEQINERLFEIMNHFNSASQFIQEKEEKLKVINLNLQASQKAYNATAYSSALDFCRATDTFLNDTSFAEEMWKTHHSLMLDLHKQRAVCEFIEGNGEYGEKTIQLAIAKAKTAIEKAEVLNSLITHYTLMSRYSEAIEAGYQALSTLGIELPLDNFEEVSTQEIAKIRKSLENKPVESLIQLADMTEPSMLMAADILITMGPPCYRSHQRLWSVLVPKVVNLTLEYGNIPQVGYSHTAFGGLLGWVDSDYITARKFGDLAVTLMKQRYQLPSHQSIFFLMIGSSIRHWFHHLSFSTQDYIDAYETGLRGGNLQYAAYAFGHNMYGLFFQGKELSGLIEDTERSLSFSKTRLNHWAIDLLQGGIKAFSILEKGLNHPHKRINWSDEAFLNQIEQHKNIQVKCIYYILKSYILLFLGDFEKALEISNATKPILYTVGTQGLLPWPEYIFSRFMILTALFREADNPTQNIWKKELNSSLDSLKLWAKYSPENYHHKLFLARAEMARLNSNIEEAITYYDKAVKAARKQNFIHWEGMANERAGLFWKENKNHQIRGIYGQQAYVCYTRWGAKTKVHVLEEEIKNSLTTNLSNLKIENDQFKYQIVEKQIRVLRQYALQFQQNQLRIDAETHAGELANATDRLRVEIAERKKAEEAIMQKNEELLLANATKDKFFSIIAHDLKSPFNAILGFSELLTEKADNLDLEKVKNYSEIINQSANMAMDLLMNLMEWARSQTGKIKFTPESFLLFPVTDQIKKLLIHQNPVHKDLKIITHISHDTVIYGDKAMVNTVLRNLVSNAVKFTDPGGVITLSAQQKPEGMEISVADTGVGIPENRVNKLFKINENISTPGTQNEKGTGLGLILCKEFIDSHNGEIWVESSADKGSVFKFILPAKREA